MTKHMPVWGYNGDPARCPAATVESFWAALGAGASGLVLRVELTQDDQVICMVPDPVSTAGTETPVSDLSLEQLLKLDAGAQWHPPGLETTPWAQSGHNRALRFITLESALQVFGRRTPLLVHIPTIATSEALAIAALRQLEQFGLDARVPIITTLSICATLREASRHCVLYADIEQEKDVTGDFLTGFTACGCQGFVATSSAYESVTAALAAAPKTDVESLVKLIVTDSTVFPESATGVISEDVLTTLEEIKPNFCVFNDDFAGDSINRAQWTAGYSHANTDTKIFQHDGIHIEIQEGGSYSGAAIVTAIPIHGDFDAMVDYEVASPHQGTTFEMAAMGIDPGYYNIDNSHLSGTKVNLTFDVHGAPPYASSECDEDDGHRLGWNNGFNLTKIGDVRVTDGEVSVDSWSAASVNMYNKYRRDVGKGAHAGSKGRLRLRRSGSIFTAYYQDEETSVWVCSGTALVQNLRDDVFIRLAAKHWKKKNPHPPGNAVTFSNFFLYQL